MTQERLVDDELLHYGVLRKSGRYPWGSGGELINTINRLSNKGLTESQIANSLDISVQELRNQKGIAKMVEKEEQRIFVTRQKNNGMSVSAISEESGIARSTVRDLLKPDANLKYKIIKGISDILEKAVAKFRFIDIGDGTEIFLGVSTTKMKKAVAILLNKGYVVYNIKQEQLGTGKYTNMKVLAAPGTTYKDVVTNRTSISVANFTSDDGGRTFDEPKPITNISLDRVRIVYDKDGGSDKDGLMELRSGVEDLSLNGKRYAQVRIGVGDKYYLKGMAVERNDMPPGADVIFYTSKPQTTSKVDVLKQQDLDSPNPFGAVVKQRKYLDKNGEEQISAINILYEEGDWSTWSKSLSSQFLSKQQPALIDSQLELAYERMASEYDTIMSLDNPIVRKHLLNAYSDSADAAAVELKAAALPRQTTAVLLPDPTISSNEVYAPNYKNGEMVSLVRHPHGGVFEIPTLRVNNKGANAKLIAGGAKDAVLINPEVAKRLSGADFDGDTVIVIPNNDNIKTAPAIKSLESFDPKVAYPSVKGMRVMSKTDKQIEMGKISNLITDMTIYGASRSEIAQAVRHSMVVIDAEKHKLNYTQSYKDNGIPALKREYQGSARSGAATIVSKAKSQKYVPQRRDVYSIDPSTGAKVFTYTRKTYINKNGVEVTNQTKSTKMYETADARILSSGTSVENTYAKYANNMKRLGDKSRLSYVNTKGSSYSPEARATYINEVNSLSSKLTKAMKNRPLERQAQILGGEILRNKRIANPDMSYQDLKTEKGRSLLVARNKLGANKPVIIITPREWEAIQMGAITSTRLTEILRNADMEQVKSYASPRQDITLPTGKQTRAIQLLNAGYTASEVATAIGATQSQIINLDY